MAITLEIANAQLAKYLAAEEAVLSGQSYEYESGGVRKKFTAADLDAIQAGIKIWNERATKLMFGSSGIRSREIIPR